MVRPMGTLQEILLRLLRDAARPVGGLELTDLLGRDGYIVASSLVFRAIRRLLDRNAIRKIQLAGGYVIRGPVPRISLCCSRCGAWDEIAHDFSFARLDAAAKRVWLHGLEPHRRGSGHMCPLQRFRRGRRVSNDIPQADTTPHGPPVRGTEVAGGQEVGGGRRLLRRRAVGGRCSGSTQGA
jgi:hypothetical protein